MNGFDSPTVLWLLLAAQLLGVSSAWLARLSEGSRLPGGQPIRVLRRSATDGGSNSGCVGGGTGLLDGLFRLSGRDDFDGHVRLPRQPGSGYVVRRAESSRQILQFAGHLLPYHRLSRQNRKKASFRYNRQPKPIIGQ